MNPVGLWTLHYDWGPKGSYSWIPLYFNFDGTFAYLAGANEGMWTQVDDKIMWRFKKQPGIENSTVYSGSATRNFMSGIMLSAQGERGHWFAVKKGTRVFAFSEKASLPYIAEKEGKPKMDPAGSKTM